jgi:hypothetical protein
LRVEKSNRRALEINAHHQSPEHFIANYAFDAGTEAVSESIGQGYHVESLVMQNDIPDPQSRDRRLTSSDLPLPEAPPRVPPFHIKSQTDRRAR